MASGPAVRRDCGIRPWRGAAAAIQFQEIVALTNFGEEGFDLLLLRPGQGLQPNHGAGFKADDRLKLNLQIVRCHDVRDLAW